MGPLKPFVPRTNSPSNLLQLQDFNDDDVDRLLQPLTPPSIYSKWSRFKALLPDDATAEDVVDVLDDSKIPPCTELVVAVQKLPNVAAQSTRFLSNQSSEFCEENLLDFSSILPRKPALETTRSSVASSASNCVDDFAIDKLFTSDSGDSHGSELPFNGTRTHDTVRVQGGALDSASSTDDFCVFLGGSTTTTKTTTTTLTHKSLQLEASDEIYRHLFNSKIADCDNVFKRLTDERHYTGISRHRKTRDDNYNKAVIARGTLGVQRFGVQVHPPKLMWIYRNGDKFHEGCAFYLKNNISKMQQLLPLLTSALPLIGGPVRRVYDHNLWLVRSIDDIVDGGKYLLTSGEPPAKRSRLGLFFDDWVLQHL